MIPSVEGDIVIKETYEEYLQSPDWHELKMASFRRYGMKCVNCLTKNRHKLQSHHLIYKEDRRAVLPEMVVPLCDYCHKKFHDRIPVKDNIHLFNGELCDVKDKIIFLLQTLGKKNALESADILVNNSILRPTGKRKILRKSYKKLSNKEKKKTKTIEPSGV